MKEVKDTSRTQRCLCFLAALLTVFFLWMPGKVYAEGEIDTYIYDAVGMFTAEQWSELQEKAAEASAAYECGVYFAAVEDFRQYSHSQDVQTATEDIYLISDFGWGAGKDGVFLLLSMSERDYALIAYGDFGNAAFTDYGKEVMSDHFLDDFADDDWYGGCLDYIEDCSSFMEQARNGQPYDVDSNDGWQGELGESDALVRISMALLPSAAFAMVVCVVLKRKMKTARKEKAAFEYVVDGEVHFRIKQDMFSHVTQTRRRIQNNNSGGNHSGGTHVNSRGFSGRSGKF